MSDKPTDPQSSATDTDSKMGSAEELSEFQRGTIVGCHLAKKSVREISALLELPQSAVKDVVVKWKRLGITTPLPRTPHKLSHKDILELERIVRENQLSTLTELTTELQSASGRSISPKTVQQELQSLGFRNQTAAKKPKGVKRKAKSDLQPDNEETSKKGANAACSNVGNPSVGEENQTEPTSKPKDQLPMDGETSTTSPNTESLS